MSLMRVANWRVGEKLERIVDSAVSEAEQIMLEVVAEAKAACPVDETTFRPAGWSGEQAVSFTPNKGKNKGHEVSFKARRWLGRKPGDLQRTIRLVKKLDKPGSLRVYAGNTKIYWARFVEYGVPSRGIAKQQYLRPAFDLKKVNSLERLKTKIKEDLANE